LSEPKFVPDDRWESAPPLPTDRPPTRAEVWAYTEHMYAGLKTEQELQAHAAFAWAGTYVYWVNFNNWDKQPDWTPGDTVVRNAVPKRGEIKSGDKTYPIVKSYLQQARRAA